MPLLPNRPFRTLLIGAATIAIAAFTFFGGRRLAEERGVSSRAPAQLGARASGENRANSISRIAASAPPLVPTSISTASTAGSRPNPVLPAAVTQLLPSVQAPVTNWKEFKPEKITIAPYPDMPIEFTAISIREEHGRTVWTGRNSAIEGAFLVAAATENEWHATLVIPPVGGFEANIAGSTVTMLEKDFVNNLCGTGPAMAVRSPVPLVTTPEEILAASEAAESSVNAVDVLFFYDADVLAAVQGNTSTLETHIISYIAAGNAALANSQVTNFHWRYLGAYQVPAYTATTDLTNDLTTITGVTPGTRGGYIFAPNAVSIFVQQKMDLHGADQAVIYVGSNPQRNFAGIAWVEPSSVEFHFAAAVWPNTPGSSSSFLTVTHEMAHNFGCSHDRTTENAPDGDGLFNYGFRYLRQGRDTGTIMSYASQAVPYFSNPVVTFEGVALGVPEGQPKAANNSRVLREAAVTLINSRLAVEPPAITTQPQSVTTTVGQPFALSVSATGNNLTYQWKLAGANLAGATSSSFSKTAAAASDAGSYTVVISNIAGTTTSDAATVTVNAAATGGGAVTPQGQNPPTSSPTPSSGGGGGGAIDAWFGTLCGLSVMARYFLKKSGDNAHEFT